jgi:hypothetical protein
MDAQKIRCASLKNSLDEIPLLMSMVMWRLNHNERSLHPPICNICCGAVCWRWWWTMLTRTISNVMMRMHKWCHHQDRRWLRRRWIDNKHQHCGMEDMQEQPHLQEGPMFRLRWINRATEPQLVIGQILISVKTFGARSFTLVVSHRSKDGPALSGWMVVRLPEVWWPVRSSRWDLTYSALQRWGRHD